MYPEPYFDREELNQEYQEIKKNGFGVDTFLTVQPSQSVFGLNIAMGWPFPVSLKEAYEKLFNELSTLGSDVYVYPYKQTHITIMTLENFKIKENLEEKKKKVENLVPKIIKLVSNEVQKFKPFKIDIGWPVILKRAAILSILNPTQEVFFLRKTLAPLLEDLLSAYLKDKVDPLNNKPSQKVEIPQKIHSTILRFLKSPSDIQGFIDKFESIAAKNRLGETTINELLLTAETKPYMLDGDKLHCFRLG